MERAGVPHKIAMSISGHKTENVYRRYDIVVERDFSDATARMEQYFGSLKAQAESASNRSEREETSTLSDTLGDSEAESDAPHRAGIDPNSLS